MRRLLSETVAVMNDAQLTLNDAQLRYCFGRDAERIEALSTALRNAGVKI